MKYINDWDKRKEQFEYFWNNDYKERCSLSILVRDKNFSTAVEGYTQEDRFTNPEVFDVITRHMFDNTIFSGNSIPSKYIDFGTSAQCEYFGGKATYKENTAWFHQILDEADISLMPNFDIKTNQAFLRQKEFIKKVVELSKGDYMVGMSDNCGNLDALSAMRSPAEFMFDMVEEPEFVTEATNRLINSWIESEHEFYKLIKENNQNGCTHGWMQIWAPGIHTQLQCDFSVMISPAMFEEFALPELQKCAKAVDYCSYHLDGIDEVRHLDMILSVKEINNIQWTPVAGQPNTSANIETLQRIQKAGKGLILGPNVSEVEFLMNNLSHNGLHMNVHGVHTEQDAKDIMELAKRCAHK